ncbi:hypothetical protein SPRG_19476 [Saprolegnia parasitica CBS 223.65]|uniref:Uncharacterized protein n=1 Tax=Saprolegnia parasitica (strain CBS 223.65) TaxID=695850 RepID=A0A067CZQ7_SAPPC|nr:hypothetical protein SPRG_19476 [Saprolegnia parasitica CBS 223.65]KDO32016.1 hypothetical protein SPRG_19476 [Saprolegnia parasitica CBS 223.65]|eukprot:XP_012197404.1 hypothetical protein SPRG_19476 [Saprolegnia parasitica CBS 223.65]
MKTPVMSLLALASTVAATQVSVCRDATYDIAGAICAGAGPAPTGIACPLKGTAAKKDCHPYLPSYDAATQTCIAKEDAKCVKLASGAWGCAFPSMPCGPSTPQCDTISVPTTCASWDYSEAETPSEINFDISGAPASWFVATGPLPDYQVGCLDGSPVQPLNPPTPKPSIPTPAPSVPTPAPSVPTPAPIGAHAGSHTHADPRSEYAVPCYNDSGPDDPNSLPNLGDAQFEHSEPNARW